MKDDLPKRDRIFAPLDVQYVGDAEGEATESRKRCEIWKK